MQRSRLVPGRLAIGPTSLFVCDTAYPVCAELDRDNGRTIRQFDWTIDPARRRLAVCVEMRLHDGEIWISSPAAGGLVHIRLVDGRVTVVPLDAQPGPIASLGADLIVFADEEWPTDGDEGEASESMLARHIEWRESDARSEHGTGRIFGAGVVAGGADLDGGQWFMYAPTQDPAAAAPTMRAGLWSSLDQDDSDPEGEVGDGGDDRPDTEWEPIPAHVAWRVVGHVVEPFDIGGDASGGVSLPDGQLLVLVRRPDHPVVNFGGPFGATYSARPAAITAFRVDGSARVVRKLEDSAELCFDGRLVWIFEDSDDGDSHWAAIDMTTGELTSTGCDVEPVAIVDGVAVQIQRTHWSPLEGASVRWSVELTEVAASVDLGTMEIPPPSDLNDRFGFVVDGADVWYAAAPATIASISVHSRSVRTVPIDVDLGGRAFVAGPPAGLDASAFERGQIDDLRATLFGGWVDEDGHVYPYIDGIVFTSLELVGAFPDTAALVQFQSVAHPGLTFAVRFVLYDELGNELELDWVGIWLMELIDAGPGLPPPSACRPDEDELVWIRQLV